VTYAKYESDTSGRSADFWNQSKKFTKDLPELFFADHLLLYPIFPPRFSVVRKQWQKGNKQNYPAVILNILKISGSYFHKVKSERKKENRGS
jgi:hypothetical protein